MNKKEKREAKKDAKFFLERARKTAKLKRIPEPSKADIDRILLRDGSRYEEIMDDIEALQHCLLAAGLAPSDIGTNEDELAKLKASSDRLNAPYRERRREEQNRLADIYEDGT